MHSLFWLIGILALMAAFYGLQAVFGYWKVRRDAQEDYTYKFSQNMIADDIPEEIYLKAYRRYFSPRGAAYMAMTLLSIILLTYPAFILINSALEVLWIATGRDVVFHPGYLVWQFMIFFSIIGLWAAIVYAAARRFHSRAPASFDSELARYLQQASAQ